MRRRSLDRAVRQLACDVVVARALDLDPAERRHSFVFWRVCGRARFRLRLSEAEAGTKKDRCSVGPKVISYHWIQITLSLSALDCCYRTGVVWFAAVCGCFDGQYYYPLVA